MSSVNSDFDAEAVENSLYPTFFPAGAEHGPGLKTDTVSGSRVFVLPNPSGLNRAYSGFDRKLVWFRALAKLLRR